MLWPHMWSYACTCMYMYLYLEVDILSEIYREKVVFYFPHYIDIV